VCGLHATGVPPLEGHAGLSRLLARRTGTVASVTRILVLSYFEPRHLPRLLAAVRGSGLRAETPVYLGSYGVGAEIGARIEDAGHRYAPMFQLRPDWYWERRRLPRDDEKTLFTRSSRSRRLGGPLPALPQLLRLSSTARVSWGIELGARFRDELRAAARAEREFARGALRGLIFGRAALGDRPQQGLVWWAHTAFVLAGRPITPELNAFWRILNRASLRLVGEEYPEFAGDPAVAAGAEAAGQRALLRGGPVRRALARKYVAGLTPGYRLAPGLGGNTRGRPRVEVNRWRERYVLARAATGVAGFGEFNFRFENSSAQVMQDVLRTLARHLG
jgi:hypothetical protein